jgi:hypothetical protein
MAYRHGTRSTPSPLLREDGPWAPLSTRSSAQRSRCSCFSPPHSDCSGYSPWKSAGSYEFAAEVVDGSSDPAPTRIKEDRCLTPTSPGLA